MENLTNIEPIWVEEDVLLAIHQRQLAEHGGLEGVRDLGLLQSALARPRHAFAYTPDIELTMLAAAHAFGIAKNHPFIDGNKRTAYIAARLFLMRNGFDIQASREDKYLAMIALAEGQWGEEEYARWLKKAVAPRA